jgi:hypothetical protein
VSNQRKRSLAGFAFKVAVFTLASVAWTLVGGCSAAKAIAKAAVEINTDATGIREEVVAAKQDLKAGDIAAVDKHLDVIDGKAKHVQETIATVQKNLPGVQDTVPYWLVVLKWGIIATVILAVIFLLWRLDAFIGIEKGIQSVVTFGAKVLGA